VERPVKFDIKETGNYAEVVHSLAKWKRFALHKYDFRPLKGLYTDMNAIRRDEAMDNIHSIYVDQWDWEKVITDEVRNIEYLKETVRLIVDAVCDTLAEISVNFPANAHIKREVTFITSQELEDMYPDLDSKGRENAFCKKHGTIFIMQIGDKLASGKPHDGRAPDYDDWKLNGDILVYYELLGQALEISSMGIRVNKQSLYEQLAKANCLDRATLPFHKALLEDKLPLTMGGGIGQSRLCMLMLNKAHIGEVQASIWDDNTITKCQEKGVELL
jgi:aspartate--ammonia ligase